MMYTMRLNSMIEDENPIIENPIIENHDHGIINNEQDDNKYSTYIENSESYLVCDDACGFILCNDSNTSAKCFLIETQAGSSNQT
ncbi:unnamed protein product [Rhizophagus irregularis]|nr:unnamed protein product [Rhizophagus irregularis]